jgi:hypothetical protein
MDKLFNLLSGREASRSTVICRVLRSVGGCDFEGESTDDKCLVIVDACLILRALSSESQLVGLREVDQVDGESIEVPTVE